jgi:hypothetical protein
VKLFANWRNVGRAMLDARRREGVTVNTVSGHKTWQADVGTVEARPSSTSGLLVDVYKADYTATNFWPVRDAAEVLRVLAALDLIPADIAYAADERYGRCEVPGCERIARWWHPEGGADGRWVHHPTRPALHGSKNHQAVVTDIPADLAEVAE